MVWLSLDPQRGREQAGRRPFLVLSPRAYNAKTSLSVGVPITSQRKGYPFEVPLKAGSSIVGVALADQVKSLDWRARLADFAEEVSPATLRSVRRLLATLLELA
ncbi:MAG: type II toxin-antitoxin system PemK/MazF family toxin [Candidatus Eremiobacteraeota bacterium]|nr:type II toxin-antitoxin system PemK/MazF family toxin [Candidatus Eremiobacteraeota bacterium]